MSCENEKRTHDESVKSVKEAVERLREAQKRARPVADKWWARCVEGVPPGAPNPPGCPELRQELSPLLNEVGEADKALHEALMRDIQNLNVYFECVRDAHKNKGVA